MEVNWCVGFLSQEQSGVLAVIPLYQLYLMIARGLVFVVVGTMSDRIIVLYNSKSIDHCNSTPESPSHDHAFLVDIGKCTPLTLVEICAGIDADPPIVSGGAWFIMGIWIRTLINYLQLQV